MSQKDGTNYTPPFLDPSTYRAESAAAAPSIPSATALAGTTPGAPARPPPPVDPALSSGAAFPAYNEPHTAPPATATADITNDPQQAAVDPGLQDRALKAMRGVLQGNGVNPASVTVGMIKGTVYVLTARMRFHIKPSIVEKTVPGREKGEDVPTRQDAYARLQKLAADESHSPTTHQHIATTLNTRKDLGFGNDGLTIPLPFLKKNYVAYDPCRSCAGQSHATCPQCHGRGVTECRKCHGSREMNCPVCGGRQRIDTAKGWVGCHRCHARGRVLCDGCQGLGTGDCVPCHKSGRVPCRDCNATGTISHALSMTAQAVGSFAIDISILPPAVPPLIQELKGEMVTDRHAQVAIRPPHMPTDDHEPAPEGYCDIIYDLTLPWGDVSFKLQDKFLSGQYFGWQPALVQFPPFLEKIAGKGLQALSHAAHRGGKQSGKGGNNGHGGDGKSVSAHLNQALRFRLTRDLIHGAAAQNPARALDVLHARYPFGIRAQTLKKSLQNADRALKTVTIRPRSYGLAAGLATGGLIAALWFLWGGRTLLTPWIEMSMTLQLLTDLLPLVVAGTLTTLMIQYAARTTLENALGRTKGRTEKGKAGKNKARKKDTPFMPKAGRLALAGWGGALALYIVMLELSLTTGKAAPLWYAAVHSSLFGG